MQTTAPKPNTTQDFGFRFNMENKHASLNRSTQPTQDGIALLLSEKTTKITKELFSDALTLLLLCVLRVLFPNFAGLC